MRFRCPAGGLPFLSPADPALNFLFLPPIPPTRARRALFPGGEGGDSRLFHARGFAPCIPSIKPLAALAEPEKQAPGGACPRRCRLTLPLWYSQGGLSFWSPAYPAFSLLFCPPSPKGKDIPPTPFPGGEGGDSRLFHARGSAPCIPSIKPLAALAEPEKQAPGGACPRRCRLTLPLWYSQGGLSFWSPAYPAFSLLFCPLSPLPPSPAGKGEIQGYFMQGAQPLASPGQNPRGTGKGGEPRTRRGACLLCLLPTLPFAFLFAPYPPTRFPGGEGGDSRLFHARGFAPCIPGAEPARHWERERTTHPAGGLPRRCRLTLPLWYSQGGLIFLVACLPCL